MRCGWFSFILLFFNGFSLFSQQPNDTTQKSSGQYGFGVIPAFSFDADIGLKYGAVFNFFDFGKAGNKAFYDQYLYLRITNTTRGTLNLQAILESETIVPKAKLIAELSYLVDRKMDFFGFNGLQSNFHPDLIDSGSRNFINKFYYAHDRKLLRIRLDLHKNIISTKLRLLTGITFQRYNISEIDAGDFREINSLGAAEASTLFAQYNEWGIIDSRERTGGAINLLTLGLIYDTRNHPCYCTTGKWAEAYFVVSPGFLSSASFSKFVATYRQHQSLRDEKVTFSYRLSLQQKITGDIPFYALPTFFDSRANQDGIGGAFNLRGALRNRIASDGFALTNVEVKFKLYEIRLLKQDFYFSASAFWDMALVTQTYKVNLSEVPLDFYDFYFSDVRQLPHHTFGPGFYIVFNHNNVITVNYGLPANRQNGSGGLYIGSALLF